MTFADLKFDYTIHLGYGKNAVWAKRAIVDFDNGYSASVVEGGLGGIGPGYEFAVMTHAPHEFPEVQPEPRRMCFDSGIESGVASWLTADEVTALLGKLEALPAR